MHRFKKKEYTREDLTVIWDYPKCMHSERCWRELGKVFRRNEKPWIDLEGASIEAIKAQIDRCPSGALSYRVEGDTDMNETENKNMEITLLKNGPMLLSGNVTLKKPDGSTENCEGNTALCRCGASSNKPFCDGSHNSSGFEG